MTITNLIPAVRKLSQQDKLKLIQVIVQEMVEAEASATYQSPHNGNRSDSSSVIADNEDDLTLEERIAFLRKPLSERRAMMTEQASIVQSYYQENTEWRDWPVDDIIEY